MLRNVPRAAQLTSNYPCLLPDTVNVKTSLSNSVGKDLKWSKFRKKNELRKNDLLARLIK